MGAFPAAEYDAAALCVGNHDAYLTIQVRNDTWTKNPKDAQKTFDMLGSKDKEMTCVENTTRRFKMATATSEGIRKKSSLSSNKNMKQAVDRRESVVQNISEFVLTGNPDLMSEMRQSLATSLLPRTCSGDSKARYRRSL